MKFSSERSVALRGLHEGGFQNLAAVAARPRRYLPCSSSFIGRSRDLVRAAGASHRSRLVTIVAPGGIGKTRLAVELTRGRVPLCNLACVRTGAELIDALRGTLGMLLPGAIRAGESQIETLAAHLPHRLILDNAEGLGEEAETVLSQLLALAPQCRVLVTSRRALGLPGEVVLPLDPLSPAASRRLARRLAQSSGKGSLLPDVAAAHGSPLALELAVGGGEVANLSTRLKLLLSGLSAFASSWSESEARATCGCFDELDIERLLDSRLIHRLPGSARFSMLPPVRDTARRVVPGEGEVINRHAALFEEIARSGEGILEAHAPELSASIDHLHAQGQHERAARMAVALTPWACSGGRIDTVLGWLRRAEATSLPARLEAEVADALGRSLLSAGRFEDALSPLRWALGFWEGEGNLSLAGRAAGNLGVSYRRMGIASAALEFNQQSVDLLRLSGDVLRLTGALTNLGQVLGESGKFTEAACAQEEAILLSGSKQNLARRYLNLAEAYLNAGDLEETRRAIRTSDALTADQQEVARATVLWEMATNGSREQLGKALERSKSLGIASSFWPQTLALIAGRLEKETLPE